MVTEFSQKFLKAASQIQRRDPLLFGKIQKQLAVFQKNPLHPSLRLHKLRGVQADAWSISLNMSVRMLFYYRVEKGEKRAVFFTVGKHEEVYK